MLVEVTQRLRRAAQAQQNDGLSDTDAAESAAANGDAGDGGASATTAEETASDIVELSTQLARHLETLHAQGRRVLLAFDALNELAPSGGAHNMTWLPAVLPSSVSVLVSAIGGDGRQSDDGHSSNGGGVPCSHVVRSITKRWGVQTSALAASAAALQFTLRPFSDRQKAQLLASIGACVRARVCVRVCMRVWKLGAACVRACVQPSWLRSVVMLCCCCVFWLRLSSVVAIDDD